LDPILRQTLIRSYYFAEALALYEQFYRPLISTFGPAREELADAGRHEDRPPTWVPLVFHCTKADRIKEIFAEGVLRPGRRGTVSFTEIPIGELDRMKYRFHEAEQVAIGFPRRYIESLRLTPAWYLKHNPEIRQVLGTLKARDPEEYKQLSPFIDEDEDVSPFQEIRTRESVSIAEAVWILTTRRTGEPLRPVIPGIKEFQAQYGRISKSYWHRSHQMEILSEWQFTVDEMPEDFKVIGEHYWRQEVIQEKELSVTLPAHERKIIFETSKPERHAAYEGPWRFADVARIIAGVLIEAEETLEDTLRYRLIRDVTTI
jgi:hypothetical protein